MLKREDWLLLFVGLPGGNYHTDQLRLMKGLFLFSQEGPSDARGLYDFQAYDYGPFDTRVYHDVRALEEAGLIESEPVEGTSRRIYRVTPRGGQRAAELEQEAGALAAASLREIKRLVTSLDFLPLLRHVYRKYPAYAANTRARV